MLTSLEPFTAHARQEIVLVGTTSLIPVLEESAAYLANHLGVETGARLTVFHESDNSIFEQSVLMATALASQGATGGARPLTFGELVTHLERIRGSAESGGLAREILEHTNRKDDLRRRVAVRELHLRTPMDIIKADDRIWYSVVSHKPRDISSYREAEAGSDLYVQLEEFVALLQGGGEEDVNAFLSEPGDELIWVYDRSSRIARGIFPRQAFYTTDFARYSVWGLVFNRQGELLLQRRSRSTRDNRGMWDKSIGGHVDLKDGSSSVTAKRELVEEMYLPSAEFTKYIGADIRDVIDFGEWNPRKRPERHFREAFAALAPDDWVMFRAVDPRLGLPLTVDRVSDRLWHDADDVEPRIRRTVFITDVYFFMAPMLQDPSGKVVLSKLVASDEAAADKHRFVSIGDLSEEISSAEREGTDVLSYTDDLLYLVREQRQLLDSIASFATYVNTAGS